MADDSQITAIIKDLGEFVEGLVQRLNLNITASLQKDTPVLTGWARANWVPSFGVPVQQVSGTRAEAELGRLDYGPQAEGIAMLSGQYKLTRGDVFITNNVDYITKLNEGSSAKAPAAFVQRAIEKGIIETGGKQ